MTGAAGAAVNTYDYDAYGQLTAATENMVTPYGFTGREFDRESGLHYFRARYYDARAGRFLSPEPFGVWDTHPNLYRYANNNPVNLFDPDGLWEFGLVKFLAEKAGYLRAAGAATIGGAVLGITESLSRYTDSQGYRDKVEQEVIEEHENLPGVRAAKNVGPDPFFKLGYTQAPDPCPDQTRTRQRSTAPRTYTPEELEKAKRAAQQLLDESFGEKGKTAPRTVSGNEPSPDPSKKPKGNGPGKPSRVNVTRSAK